MNGSSAGGDTECITDYRVILNIANYTVANNDWPETAESVAHTVIKHFLNTIHTLFIHPESAVTHDSHGAVIFPTPPTQHFTVRDDESGKSVHFGETESVNHHVGIVALCEIP